MLKLALHSTGIVFAASFSAACCCWRKPRRAADESDATRARERERIVERVGEAEIDQHGRRDRCVERRRVARSLSAPSRATVADHRRTCPDERRDDSNARLVERETQHRLAHAPGGAVDGDRHDWIHRDSAAVAIA